jgi:dTDP-3-amino-3,4,6-trideoxy-alpha-D-glucose transaminase
MAAVSPAPGSAPAPPIRLVDLAEQHRRIQDEIETAVLRVLRSGVYVLGPEVAAFEAELAASCGARHAVACASGTDALTLSLLSLGLAPGDEVIVPSFTIFVDAEVVSLLGGVPRFAEIDPRTFTLDPARLLEAVTPRTRAVLVTHLYGTPADMDGIRAVAGPRGIAVIEDACQAIGSRYRGRPVGALGDLGCFSFFPTKNLGACGDGGAITTDDADRAASLRRLRNHGARAKYVHEAVGLNSRLDEVQAAVLRVKLRHLPPALARRGELAARYDAGLGAIGVATPARLPDRETNHHQYTIRSPRRDALRAALAAAGIEAAVHYPLAPFQAPAYAGRYPEGAWPEGARAAAEVISLPLHPTLDLADVDRVVAAVAHFLAGA